MADKDFKVKTGLDLPAPLPVTEGGTGQTTVENTRNAIMPAQVGHSGKFITTDGTSMTWAVAPQQTATDGAVGNKVFAGNTAPSGQNIGDLWIDASTGNGIQLVRWRKTIASATSTISGLDDNNLTLSYTAGNEQVYINGTLITRGQDYTATNGTSISLTQAVEVGDTVEIFGNPLFSVTDTYTQAQANNLYVARSGYDVAGKNKLINGAFDIWQRGITFSSGLINSYAGDRWKLTYDDSGGMLTASRVDISNLNIGFKYAVSVKNTGGTAANANVRMQQAFETHDTHMMRGKTYTLSFYARKIAGTNARITHMPGWTSTETNTFGSSDEIQVTIPSSSLTGAFQRFSQTFVASTNASYNSMKIQIDFQYLNNLNDELQVTGVQLEEGSIATSFSRATGNIQGELAACQRYYEEQGGVNTQFFANGYAYGSTVAAYVINFQPKRGVPSVSVSAATDFMAADGAGSGINITSASLSYPSINTVSFYAGVASGLTLGRGSALYAANTNARIRISAEI